MTPLALRRAADDGGPRAGLSPGLIARWLVGLRLVAVSALLVGALVVQATTDELLPIERLARVAGLAYVLSLVWIALLFLRIPPRLHGGLQLGGDLFTIAVLIYVTGGLWSPFPFLFLIPVALAALMLGLRGALIVAGGAFVLYAAMAEAMVFRILPTPPYVPPMPAIGKPALPFQLFLTGTGFALVALLTSYLAHSLQLAESRLRGERERAARLLALSADVVRSVESGVVATDPEGRVVLSNPAATQILGAGGSLEGRRLTDLIVLEGVGWPAIMHDLGRGVPVRVEGTVPETRTPLGCTIAPLRGGEGGPLGLVAHFRDLTEAREAAQRERLRERLAAVGEMAAGIAHEIRNPLASISGSAQVLGGRPGLAETERHLLRIIVEESRRLSAIVESFLGFARPPDPQREPCDIARTLEETLTLFRNSSEVGESHRIESEVLPHSGVAVADERQLRQAFFNLARNAIQAMPQGGTMRVQARPESGHYTIRWQDEGIGMQPSQIQEIFQPFKAFRTGGTGLGLAVVYSIVTDHGGEIEVASAPGQGSTFTLRIPLRQA